MNTPLKHAHTEGHREHHYLSNIVRDEHFWVGVGITLIIATTIALFLASAGTETPLTPYYLYFK